MRKGIIILGVTISLILISIGIYGCINSGDLSFLNNKEDRENNQDNDNITLSINDLQNALTLLKSANNFSENIKITSSIETNNMETIIKADLLRQEDEALLSVKGETAMHTYTVLEEEKLVTYSLIPMFGISEWIKSTEETSLSYDNSYLDIILDNISLFKIENNVFKGILSKESAMEIYNSNEDSNDNTEIIGNILIEIRLTSDKNIETIVFDYSNNIKFDEEVVSSYIVTNGFSDIGTTKIVVPEDVKNSAKTN